MSLIPIIAATRELTLRRKEEIHTIQWNRVCAFDSLPYVPEGYIPHAPTLPPSRGNIFLITVKTKEKKIKGVIETSTKPTVRAVNVARAAEVILRAALLSYDPPSRGWSIYIEESDDLVSITDEEVYRICEEAASFWSAQCTDAPVPIQPHKLAAEFMKVMAAKSWPKKKNDVEGAAWLPARLGHWRELEVARWTHSPVGAFVPSKALVNLWREDHPNDLRPEKALEPLISTAMESAFSGVRDVRKVRTRWNGEQLVGWTGVRLRRQGRESSHQAVGWADDGEADDEIPGHIDAVAVAIAEPEMHSCAHPVQTPSAQIEVR
ncbi:hypothetical protein SAMN05444156_2325 [Verrucomicrobium sp. GAS474]|uniref:hypothetical protein n=1 Tax=Verrucomicrobium sp. GAS474 TaxID=1882831 RepID=UPI00087D3C7A|nr:hypothetical protein [Verrucomicrobium sp. GAS474]SDU16008.1 hypothetical protein SAMN05444156_2325 [Verrucomicrobium sp. GAS474]